MPDEQHPGWQSTSIIICSIPRSGSWLLAELLEQTSRCGHPREYFRPDYERIYAREWRLKSSYSFGDYLAAVRTAGSTENGVFASKLHWAQYSYLLGRLGADADLGAAAALAPHFPRPVFVRLRRADKAAQAVSWFRAIRSDTWWDVGDQIASAGNLVSPDLAAIAELEETLIEQERSWDAVLGHGPEPIVEIEYRDLCDDYAATARRLMTALGQPTSCAPVAPQRLRKQADTTSQAWVGRLLSSREDLMCEQN